MNTPAGTVGDFDPLRALPNAAFRDPVWFEAEMQHIWHGDWVFATTEDALGEPGDQVPVMVGRQPVLVLRRQDGELAAIGNLCTHRGTLLVDQPCNAKRIQCPYHAWTFADSGDLLSVPFSPKGEVDKAERSLPRYRVDTWHGLVFVSQNHDVEPLSERFAVVDQALTHRNIDALHHWPTDPAGEVWDCNWKLAMVNAMESYHLFQVHPKTLEPYTPTKDSSYVAGSARATITANAATDGSRFEVVSLPPGFVGVVSDKDFVWLAVDPLAPDRCRIRSGGAFATAPPASDASRLTKWMSQAGAAAAEMTTPDFLPEDKAICERGQRGAVGDFDPGPILEVERVVRDFGHYLAWRLLGIDPPPAR